MKQLKCKHKGCDKVIEGYNDNHVQFLMRQHMMKHENEEKKKELKEWISISTHFIERLKI